MSDNEHVSASAPTTEPAADSVTRVGFLGASSIAHKVWAAIEGAGSMRVTVVGARDAAKAEAFIQECAESLALPEARLPVAATYDQLVASADVDVIYMSIPVTARHEWVMKCVENGKHLVGEKPPATDGDKLREWLEALSAKKLLYMDGTMFSHGPYIDAVVKALPRIGKVRRMTSNFTFLGSDEFRRTDIRCDPALEPMGCLGDMGWYCVRAFLHVMNFAMPIAVAGRVLERNEKGAIMAFSGELTFSDPENPEEIITGQLYCGFVSSDENTLIVSGSEGTLTAPQIIIPVTDKPAAFEVVKAAMYGESTRLRVTREVETVTVPQETGHTQETEMWRDVRDCLRKDDTGAVVVDEVEGQKWGKRAWITQCILDKLMESAAVQAAAAPSA